MKMYRQGDILIVSVDSFTNEVQNKMKPVHNLHLAEGEVTGHFHCLETNIKDAIAAEHGNEIFFEIAEQARITHQEHSTIELPAGKYKKIQQVEYTPEAYRNVAD
jgi:hypothetical protein